MSGPNKLIPTPVSDLMDIIAANPRKYATGQYLDDNDEELKDAIIKAYQLSKFTDDQDINAIFNSFREFANELNNKNTAIEKLKPFYRRRPALTSVLAAGAFVGSVAGAFPLTVGLVVGGIGLGVGWPIAIGVAAATVVAGVGYVAIERPYQRKLAKAKAERADFVAQAKLDMAAKHGLVLSNGNTEEIDRTLSSTNSNLMRNGATLAPRDLLMTKQGLAMQAADPADLTSKTAIENTLSKKMEPSKVIEVFNASAVGGINISDAKAGRNVVNPTFHTLRPFSHQSITPTAACKITNDGTPPQEIGKFHTDGAKMTTTLLTTDTLECQRMAEAQLRAAEALNPGQKQVFTFKNVGKPGQKNFRIEDMQVTINTAMALVEKVLEQDNTHLFSFKIDKTLENCINKSNNEALKIDLKELKRSIKQVKETPEPSSSTVTAAATNKKWPFR